MADQTLSVKIIGDSSSLSKAVDEAKSKLGSLGGDDTLSQAEASGSAVGNKLVGALKKVITVAAVGKFLTDTIKAGAQYEQAVGGIETLFKGYEDQMIQYANVAWKTAGISANQYMEQSTSFAAALLQSLGGDSKKAGEAANQAVIDMADNANKMGTPLENIQNAYQGFAKQNYTMLDNLKLGYGGTKTEMERLLSDAEKITGQEYDISNLSDVYDAIHVIQGELGITGTTAEEAERTISGSFNSMKSAFTNFMSQLTTGGDVQQALTDLTDSAVTFVLGNLVPALGRIIGAIPAIAIQLIGTTLPQIINDLTTKLSNLLDGVSKESTTGFFAKLIPQVISAIGKLLLAVVKAIFTLVPKLFSAAKTIGKSFISGLWATIKSGIAKGFEWLRSKFSGLKLSLPHIKLPHFKLTGDFSLKKKTVPKLSVEWYKTGGIFNSPSIIGVGDSPGPEAVVPIAKLQDYVRDAIPTQNSGSIDYSTIARAMKEAISEVNFGTVINLDSNELARGIAEPVNKRINQLQTRNNRKLGMAGV